ncbi:dihydrolipoamide acetyltransferase family protein [Halosolutus halophilus]|uniref:dihydrolipoamide acetyltransferase family protein n=1 Tax=Halosolutus halophilus TaxID=1552990 RepID=UPI00223509D9|nr:dihydrolipoamide acetyltransferase family protein [Halosolutus halophilus]
MVTIVRIPKLGLSEYGELVSWEVERGHQVSEGDVVAVLESDKASAEIESPADGTLLQTYVEEGEEISIEVGKPLAVVGEEGETPPSLTDIEDESEPSTEGASTVASERGSEPASETDSSPDITATPRAKRRAREADVDLSEIEGTGPQGAISEDDVEEHLTAMESEQPPEPVDEPDLTVVESTELTGTRKVIADRLSRSAREKPHVMGTREIPIEQLETFRDQLTDRFDVEVSLNDLLVSLVGQVLEDLPEFNAHFEDGEHKLIDEVNVGYAVDGERGLVVPVIRTVTDRSLPELAEHRHNLVQRVLEGDHTPEDLRGGTFTVTNVGVFDIDISYSIINPPEVAILALGRRKYAPVERDGSVGFEKVITMSLTIDHRVLDGADSGRFLERLTEYVEEPEAVFDTNLVE